MVLKLLQTIIQRRTPVKKGSSRLKDNLFFMHGQLTFKEFQDFIQRRYGDKDSARGAASTFLWLAEEVGELASELAREDVDRQALACEFADILGWLATLANMHSVDLEEAVRRVYLEGNERDHKT